MLAKLKAFHADFGAYFVGIGALVLAMGYLIQGDQHSAGCYFTMGYSALAGLHAATKVAADAVSKDGKP